MAEDAYNGKKILIVDDINDSGATLNYIKQDWQESCLSESDRWFKIWGDTVRVAVLCDNESSDSTLKINYSAVDLNKAEEDCWIVFPWEDWWK
jgi:hypoxanthine phosphoribosyltransferase